MADVATALKTAIMNCIGPENCAKCEYRDIRTKTSCKTMLLRDALELLKEQEPVEPHKVPRSIAYPKGAFVCPDCSRFLEPDDPFCPGCGRKVKWDD